MQITELQKREFYTNGYLHIPGVVPEIMVNEALRNINHSIGNGISMEEIETLRIISFCNEIKRSACIMDLLYKTPAIDLIESLVGSNKLQPVTYGQVAIRFPLMDDPPIISYPHLDGMHAPLNGVPAGIIQNFTVLAGVLLSEVTDDYSGNLTVWPGTHHQYEEYFQKHGSQALLEGMPPIELPEPVQLRGKPGDLYLAHYLLAHTAGPNVSPHPRYATFYRMFHVDTAQYHWESMQDMWMEWDGMKEIVSNMRK